MGTKMTWEEMKKKYPDEWLLIADYETDDHGHLTCGVVERHSPKTREVAKPPSLKKPVAFCYTGESTFMGLRSHATHHHTF